MAPKISGNFEAVQNRLTAHLKREFLDSVSRITNEADQAALERAILARDTNEVMRVLNMTPAAFYDLDRAIDDAFYAGATREGKLIDKQAGAILGVRFDGRHRRAENYVREAGGRLIVEINEDTRQVVNEHVRAGIEAGRGAREMSLDLIGRMPKGSRVREGGVVGLHSTFARYVRNAREELENGDPNYLTRERRNRRGDKAFKESLESGKPLTKTQINSLVSDYSDSLLQLRGQTIARTEALKALNAGRYEMARQLVDSGKVPQNAITFIWDATPSERTRDSHLALNGEEVQFGQPFTSISGDLLLFPGDTSMGAGPGEVINCRCTARTRIDRRILATAKPRGRPVGSTNRPKGTVPTPPPVPPPVAPPMPAPAPEPEPQRLPYETIPPIRNKDDLNRVAAQYVEVFQQPNGSSIAQADRMIRHLAEVIDRFDLPKLRGVGVIPANGRRPGQNALGVCWMNLGAVYFLPKLYNAKRMEGYLAGGRQFRVRESDKHKKEVRENPSISPEVKRRSAEMWYWDFTVKPQEKDKFDAVEYERLTHFHEMGHYLHSKYLNELYDIVRLDWSNWKHLVSKYGGTNSKEYIAETFTIYMMGDESQYFRIMPELLAWYQRKDREHGRIRPSGGNSP